MDFLILGVLVFLAFQARRQAKNLAFRIHKTKEQLMANVAEVLAAVDAARAELEADKQAILAELARLGLPDEDLQPIIDAVGAFGSALDDVPGVTPAPAPEPEPAPEEPIV